MRYCFLYGSLPYCNETVQRRGVPKPPPARLNLSWKGFLKCPESNDGSLFPMT